MDQTPNLLLMQGVRSLSNCQSSDRRGLLINGPANLRLLNILIFFSNDYNKIGV